MCVSVLCFCSVPRCLNVLNVALPHYSNKFYDLLMEKCPSQQGFTLSALFIALF